MNVHRPHRGLVASMVAVIVIALGVAAQNASATIVRLPNGHKLGITVQRHVSQAAASPSAPSAAAATSWNGTLGYYGGPVVHSSRPYLVFWTPGGESIPASSKTLLERWLTDGAADSGKSSNALGVLRQYTDASGFADYKQTFSTSSQVITDAQPYPARDTTNCPDVTSTGTYPYPSCVTDAQINSELARLTQANGLPTAGDPNTLTGNAPIYIMVFPNNVNVCFPINGGTRCGDNYFCSYHGNFANTSNQELLYTVDLTLPDYLHPKQCQTDAYPSNIQQPNGDRADLTIGLLVHEYAEVLTDPEYNAWNFNGNEVGDACVNYAATANPQQRQTPFAYAPTLGGSASAGTLYDQSINGNPYYTQSLWSNGDLACHLKPAAGTISPSFSDSAPAAPGTAVSFDPTASTSSDGYTSVTWNWGDGTSSFVTGSPATVQHTYTSAGTYTATVTLVDTAGNIATASHTIEIGSKPTVSTDSSSGVGTGSATVAGSVNPNGVATTYQFDYGTSTSYCSQSPASPGSAGSGTTAQNESANLTDLSAGTTYHYRIEATNSAGTSYGSDQTFTTSAVQGRGWVRMAVRAMTWRRSTTTLIWCRCLGCRSISFRALATSGGRPAMCGRSRTQVAAPAPPPPITAGRSRCS